MAKKAIFNGIWPIFDIFHSLWPYLCSKGGVLSLYKQAICMRPDDEPFLLLGPPFMTGDGLKKVHFGPKIAKPGRLVNVPKWPNQVLKRPKWSTEVFLIIWDSLRPIWTLLYQFGQKWIFSPMAGLSTWLKQVLKRQMVNWIVFDHLGLFGAIWTLLYQFGKKWIFCPKWTR